MIITLLRKPLEGTVAENTLKHGCGAINIDATRIPLLKGEDTSVTPQINKVTEAQRGFRNKSTKIGSMNEDWKKGRWPANFILTHLEGCTSQDEDWACAEGCPAKEIDSQSGHQKSGVAGSNSRAWGVAGKGQLSSTEDGVGWKAYGSEGYGDEGGASRFFKQFNCTDRLIEYLRLMITPPVEDASILISDPNQINFEEYLALEGASIAPIYQPTLHGAILLGEPSTEQASKIYNILKSGGHLILVPENLGSRAVCELEDAGFEVRDAIFIPDSPEGFYYTSKAGRSEREAGVTPTANSERANNHPTVKPIDIMEWCARDIEPRSKVIDPFMGSGTTGIAMSRLGHDFVGVELQPEYGAIAEARIRHWMPIGTEVKSESSYVKPELKEGSQVSIFDLLGESK